MLDDLKPKARRRPKRRSKKGDDSNIKEEE